MHCRSYHSRRGSAALLLALAATGGCAFGPGPGTVMQNPNYVAIPDGSYVYSQVVNVVDDYFTIEREEPVRQEGQVLTEGRIETVPETGSTLFEPWRGDSANSYERLESTLQSIQRRASVRVIPSSAGYLVDLAVYKELEDVQRPEHATSGAATLRNDSSLQRYTEPVGGQTLRRGWIPMGRDSALEQRMLWQLQERIAHDQGRSERRWW